MELFWEILLILGLILINGFFAAAEIAIIALRKSKTQELIKQGIKSAEIVNEFQNNSQSFLATIQVGITFVGTFASAFGGARMIDDVGPLIAKIPLVFFKTYSDPIAFIVVVVLISYFSLVLGELVPKALALHFTEKVALGVSYPIKFFSYIFKVFVVILTFSSNILLSPFKNKKGYKDAGISEAELRSLLAEGTAAGTIEKREHQFLENVFEFGDLDVGKVMIPHNRMDIFDVELTETELVNKLLKHNHTRIPVYEDKVDNIIGIIYSKDVFAKLAKKQSIDVRSILRVPLFVPSTQRLHDLLQKFKKAKMHMAIVLDEYGGVDGLITLEDILEEIVGDIQDEADKLDNQITKRDDGTYIIDGVTSITDFNRELGTSLPEDASYSSISGFILDLVKRFPNEGEKIKYENLRFKIKAKNNKRIKKISVRKIRKHKKK